MVQGMVGWVVQGWGSRNGQSRGWWGVPGEVESGEVLTVRKGRSWQGLSI